MYTSTVLAVGTAISAIFTMKSESIWILELPEAEQILQICEAIVIARSEENLEE